VASYLGRQRRKKKKKKKKKKEGRGGEKKEREITFFLRGKEEHEKGCLVKVEVLNRVAGHLRSRAATVDTRPVRVKKERPRVRGGKNAVSLEN